jgi:hypothetical protein
MFDAAAEIAREIERLFGAPHTQSQVSRAAKRVDDWLQAIKVHPPGRSAQRTVAAGPRRNEPKLKVSGSGHGVVRNVIKVCGA